MLPVADAAAVAATAGQAADNMTQLIVVIVLGVVLTIALFFGLAVVVSMLNYQETPVRDRLLLLKDLEAERLGVKSKGAFDDLKDALITYSGPISRSLYGQNVKYQKEIKNLLTEAGLPDTDTHVWEFLAKRVAAGLATGAVLGAITLPLTGNITFAMMGLIFGMLVGAMVPQMLLRSQGAKRKTELRYTLPDTLDLMVVCVEAGLGLDSTISRVADETERMAPEISYEFKRLNKELNAGISRIEAFQSLGQRAGVEELRSLCAMIIQADKLGTSISDTLRVYADDLRVKRRQKAEELASKASIKMTFPLVMFIFPPLFIVLMGPVVINSIQFFTNQGGG